MKAKISIATLLVVLVLSSCGSESVESTPSNDSVEPASPTLVESNENDKETVEDSSSATAVASVEDDENVKDEVVTVKERIGSKFNPLSVGDSIDLVTNGIEQIDQVFFLSITLKEFTNDKAVFTVKVNDIVNGAKPLQGYHDIDYYYNDLWFFGNESAMALDANGDQALSFEDDFLIGYGEEKDITVQIPNPQIQFIAVHTDGTAEAFGYEPTDQDYTLGTAENGKRFHYLTVFSK